MGNGSSVIAIVRLHSVSRCALPLQNDRNWLVVPWPGVSIVVDACLARAQITRGAVVSKRYPCVAGA
jgi:hypothetical protein